jgi:Flp pilus assembly protein TadD
VNSIEDLLSISEGFLDAHRFKQAIEYCDTANSKQPTSKGYELKGLANYALLNPEEALQNFSQAISLDPANHNAYFNRGMIWLEKQELENAKADFTQAHSLWAENLIYMLNLASVHLRLKELDACNQLCDTVLQREPHNFDALCYKADILVNRKQWTEAEKYYRYLIDFAPDDIYLLNNLGFSLTFLNKLQEAKVHYKKAIDLLPDFSYSWDNLGYIYYLEKNYDEALKLINHSIALDASNSWALKNRALVYLAQHNRDGARQDLLHALQLGYTQDYDNEVDELLKVHF